MGNEATPVNAMAFYLKVRELAAKHFPDRKVGFSANINGNDAETWYPAKLRDGALFIDFPGGGSMLIGQAHYWKFTLRGKGPYSSAITEPGNPGCRNFDPELIVKELIRCAARGGNSMSVA